MNGESSNDERLQAHWDEFRRSVSRTNHQNPDPEHIELFQQDLKAAITSTVCCARRERKRWRAQQPVEDLSDETISKLARFTDALPLVNYSGLLSLVPRLVNVVSLAEALPIAGSGTTLPLDLHAVASRCTNAYLAPRRFAAVQLAFATPRCRVLVFRKPLLPLKPTHPHRTLTQLAVRVRRYGSARRHRCARPTRPGSGECPRASPPPPPHTQAAQARWRHAWPSSRRCASSRARSAFTCRSATFK